MRGLYGVARIALLDRDGVQHTRGADLMTPHLLHAGHPRTAPGADCPEDPESALHKLGRGGASDSR